MSVWTLKRGDTKGLRAQLMESDGTPKDLEESTVRKLNIKLSNGIYLQRDFEIETPPGTDGWAIYDPIESDWDVGSAGAGTKASPYTVGGFIPSLPVIEEGDLEHVFECEVVDAAGVRTTFPNGANHVLRISDDLGDG